MNRVNDYIYVGKNLEIKKERGYDNDLSNGILEAAGDVVVQADNPVIASGYHKLLLSGNQRQTLQIQEGASFHIVELSNYSEDGVYSESIFGRDELIRNGCKIYYAGISGEYGRTLQEDTVVEGDLRLTEDTLDLNGHTLTVTGDFI